MNVSSKPGRSKNSTSKPTSTEKKELPDLGSLSNSAGKLSLAGHVNPQILTSYVEDFPNLVKNSESNAKSTSSKSKKAEITSDKKNEKPKCTSQPDRKQAHSTLGNKKQQSTTFDHLDLDDSELNTIDFINKLLDTSRSQKSDYTSTRPNAKKFENATSEKGEVAKRSLRSGQKYKDFSSKKYVSQPFSIYSIEWYFVDKDYYDNKLYEVLSDFAIPKENQRDGNNKLFYNYLLLDSRRYPNRSNVNWKNFIDGIIYVGKGKNKRAHDHIKDAAKYYLTNNSTTSKKINKIVEIWEDGSPVLILEFAKNIVGIEAYTREAFMIDAIGKARLSNAINGTYYGVASTMNPREKREMGAILLIEARHIFINSGAYEEHPKNQNTFSQMNNISFTKRGTSGDTANCYF